jgi:hypothetical protein
MAGRNEHSVKNEYNRLLRIHGSPTKADPTKPKEQATYEALIKLKEESTGNCTTMSKNLIAVDVQPLNLPWAAFDQNISEDN